VTVTPAARAIPLVIGGLGFTQIVGWGTTTDRHGPAGATQRGDALKQKIRESKYADANDTESGPDFRYLTLVFLHRRVERFFLGADQ
jgi:hypothetical protein